MPSLISLKLTIFLLFSIFCVISECFVLRSIPLNLKQQAIKNDAVVHGTIFNIRAVRVQLRAAEGEAAEGEGAQTSAMTNTETNTEIPVDESPAEKYKREKLAEIAEKKAQEVFVTRETGRYECQACGYVYDEKMGYKKKNLDYPPGTPFAEMEGYRCPECGANKKYFVPVTETLSGFKENQKYGFGGNSMTGGQKQNIIFGGLFIGFLIFMSGYLME